jgi:hypothetical protein
MSHFIQTFEEFIDAIINGKALECSRRNSDEWHYVSRGKGESLNLLFSLFSDKDVIYRIKPHTRMAEKGRVVYECLEGIVHISRNHYTEKSFRCSHVFGKFLGFMHPICEVKEEI